MELHVSYGKQQQAVRVGGGSGADGGGALSAADLQAALADQFRVAPATIKLLVPGLKGALRLQEEGDTPLEAAGIRNGARLKMVASSAAGVAAMQGQADDRTLRGFDDELRLAQRRAGGGAAASPLPAGPHTFRRFHAWQRPGLAPPPSEALKLLHRLAADPGIAGVMAQHHWAVGVLSEMPPEGKVGVSPVCILGVNINRGQEISLRMRTDDLKGFRRYDRIRETLLHELAHMVWGDHDDRFKALNSQLRRECDAYDWRGAAARSLAGPAFEGSVSYDLPPELQTTMQQTAASSGQTLRQLAGLAVGEAPPTDAKQAAAEAALRRAAAGEPGAGPSSQQPQQPPEPQQPQWLFSKGQWVLYRHRDGSVVEAQVVAVDGAAQPPSYGIELPGSGYRETEGSRLQPLSQQVQGLDHRDAATEEKEVAVRQLEQ